MTLPTGSGSERLRRVTLNGNTGWTEIFSGTPLHIYTILSIIYSDRTNTTQTISIRVNDGSNDISFIESLSVGPYKTFVFNEKFVMEDDDDLDVYNSGSEADWYVSFIDQDWT